jgi:hypothetical protein
MATWKSAVSLGKHVEGFNEGELTLPTFVAAVQAEFRANPYYSESDICHAVEALSDLHLPDVKSEGQRFFRPKAIGEVLGECECRLQRLETIAAKDHRIYVSRVLRHFER